MDQDCESCIWTQDNISTAVLRGYKTECHGPGKQTGRLYLPMTVREFKYCPYCGEPIEVRESQ